MKTYTVIQIEDAMIREIKDEIIADGLHEKCDSFARLHDYCDANTLGGQPMLLWLMGEENAITSLNIIQRRVDSWLQRGAPTEE